MHSLPFLLHTNIHNTIYIVVCHQPSGSTFPQSKLRPRTFRSFHPTRVRSIVRAVSKHRNKIQRESFTGETESSTGGTIRSRHGKSNRIESNRSNESGRIEQLLRVAHVRVRVPYRTREFVHGRARYRCCRNRGSYGAIVVVNLHINRRLGIPLSVNQLTVFNEYARHL